MIISIIEGEFEIFVDLEYIQGSVPAQSVTGCYSVNVFEFIQVFLSSNECHSYYRINDLGILTYLILFSNISIVNIGIPVTNRFISQF